jgi:hypothetical protein
MRNLVLSFLAVILLGGFLAQARERIVDQASFDLSLMGQPVGRMTVSDLEIDKDGSAREALRTETSLSLKRMGEELSVSQKQFEVFDGNGKLAYFRSEQNMSSVAQIAEGWVEGEECRIVKRSGKSGSPIETRIPWDPETVSERQVEKDYIKLIQGPIGGEMTHTVFIPDFEKAVPTTSKLVRLETKETLFGPQELFRIDVTMDLGFPVTTTAWADGAGDPFEFEVNMGMFKMSGKRVSGAAPMPPSASLSLEIFEPAILRVEKKIPDPERIRRAVYLLQFLPGATPEIYEDEGQKTLGTLGRALRLQVESLPDPGPFPMSRVSAPDGEEGYLQPTQYMQSDDPAIREAALKAVGGEGDAWKRCKLLERWVHDFVDEKSLGVGFASAKEVLETREGDCSEHAVLLAAACRAAGIPARAAEGLIYAESIGGFGYHMWTEVYLDGWRDLDATRPGAAADATHIQLGASGLDGPMSADMAIQLLRFFGKFTLEVESAE